MQEAGGEVIIGVHVHKSKALKPLKLHQLSFYCVNDCYSQLSTIIINKYTCLIARI